MKTIKIILCLFFASFAFISCDLSDNSGLGQSDETFVENFGISVSKDFIGQVVDVDNHPIQNAEIKIGSSTVQTDVNGVFIINGANVYEKFAYITAKKAGYVDGSRAMVPTSGKNNVKIMLITNTPLQTITSGVESEVTLPNGTKVSFDGNFQDENGNSYSGQVNVSMFHLTPSNENIDKLMPGMLYAQTKTNQEAVLETFGMLNVELRGSAGQKLNIELGHKAEITMKIDDSQTATAPNTIPLWYFDEYRGYWKEDGVARKIGNNYVGEVSHFSWWNCDTFSSTVSLTITVVDTDGNPTVNAGVGLVVTATNFTSYILPTATNGQISGLVPANQAITLNIYDICGDIISTSSIGPFTSDTVLPNIVITPAMATPTIVQGTLLKCDNTNVTNGYVKFIRSDGFTSFYPVTDGFFSFNMIHCATDMQFKLKGVDFDNNQQTGNISYSYATPITYVGNLMTCASVDEFISYQIDSNPTVFILQILTARVSFSPSSLFVNGNSPTTAFSLSGNHYFPGIYNYGSDFTMTAAGINVSATAGNTIRFTINQVGYAGSFLDMTFGGTYTDSVSGEFRNITGVVHVRQTN